MIDSTAWRSWVGEGPVAERSKSAVLVTVDQEATMHADLDLL